MKSIRKMAENNTKVKLVQSKLDGILDRMQENTASVDGEETVSRD